MPKPKHLRKKRSRSLSIIAERVLASAKDPSVQVSVKLSRPILSKEGPDYRCFYEIVGAGANVRHFASGIDEFQALWLSFGMIEADLFRIQKSTGHLLLYENGNGWFKFLTSDSAFIG